mmetsp:Transcript_149105/g.277887  ORF Transcript_149105/g.277887 Transcript_149105/m.277887 type:complete len:419 (-) Transcript_149105:27-1283(-)
MHAVKGTPSKARRTSTSMCAAEFQRTPLPLPPRSICGGSPLLGDCQGWTEGCVTTPVAATQPLVPITPHRTLATPPAAQGTGLTLPGLTSPMGRFQGATERPARVSMPATPMASRRCQASMPSLPSLASPTSPCQASVSSHKVAFCSTPVNAVSSSVQLPPCIMTPSKVITISTPLRPDRRQKAKEMQEEIKTAVEEQSVPLLKAALQRRHACAGEHSLHEAVRQACVPAVRMLIQSRAEPNARCLGLEKGCEFPLQLAVFCSGNERCQAVELLLRAGARPSPRRTDREANTPLHDAIRRGEFGMANVLLRHLADPNAVNGFGETPLHLLLRQEGGFLLATQLRSMAEALLRSGASPLAPDGHGLLPGRMTTDAQLRTLLERWARWWRCRTLAWVHSRGRHAFRNLCPELLLTVARFM